MLKKFSLSEFNLLYHLEVGDGILNHSLHKSHLGCVASTDAHQLLLVPSVMRINAPGDGACLSLPGVWAMYVLRCGLHLMSSF